MIDNHFPVLSERPSCQDYPLEWWFPEEIGGKSKAWSRTPNALKARSICEDCPVLMECRNYALAYLGLAGIWGGLDHQERKALQGKLGITPIFMTDTYNRNSYSLLGGVKDGR